MNLSLSEICQMCDGSLSNGSNPDILIDNVVIDSRNVVDNSLFIAIKGENSDGHLFVQNALKGSVAAAIVSSDCGLNLPNLIYVNDTVKALGELAHNYRKNFTIPVIGITGSNGKTTVKEMLNSICKVKFGKEHVLATSGNLNNHLGVPLTLLEIESIHKIAIIEMGMNHSGELDYLSNLVSPDIAVVNNVMLAHAGFFNDISEIARAKGEIYNGLKINGTACINLDIPEHNILLENIKDRQLNIVNYGINGSTYYIKSDSVNVENNSFVLVTNLGEIEVNLQILGLHNQKNALTAAVIACQIGCDLREIKEGLEKYSGFKGRLEKKIAFNGATIVDDSYNANPDSVKAAIRAIYHLPHPHWFIFADLKELGRFETLSHEEVGEYADTHGIDLLITYGNLAKIATAKFQGSSLNFDNREDMVKYCLKNLPGNATLLVKGSNSMKLNEVVKELVMQERS